MKAGRYVVCGQIASGGMATVHLGRLFGPGGFAKTVAIKRLHPKYARDPALVAMLLDEARLAARVSHPNVVPILDVVGTEGELLLVMEYVQGDSLAALLRAARTREERVSPAIATNIMSGVLHGLHAAHEATDERGRLLDIVHRDVSPQNILVGVDGTARVLDFGIAKAVGRSQSTSDGSLKGKLSYMAPEQIEGRTTRRSDIYAAAVVLWEMLAVRPLFASEVKGAVAAQILLGKIPPLREVVDGVPDELEAVVMRGLARDPELRFGSAREMALALERAAPLVPPSTVGAWVGALARETLTRRAALVRDIERDPEPLSSASLTTTTSLDHADGPRTITIACGPKERPISAQEPAEVPRARRSGPLGRAAFVLTGLAIAAVLAGLAWAKRQSPKPVVVEPSSASADATPPALTFTEVREASADPVTPAPPTSSPATRSSASAAPTSTTRRMRPQCVPPYREVVVDGHVRRVLKPECL